ncbi:MAG: LacI family DNA-binding transcriptional regulator [Akkermansiaceae bacterium]|nr:LacI family DNA-binding transcriptional regulator [Verrucomicrobiales bacterium]
MDTKRISLKDLAEKLGVTKATVSMALRNSPRISPARKQQIQKLAAKMGYVRDPFLTRLAAYRRGGAPAKVLGVLAWVNHWEHPEALRQRFREFESYWQGTSEAARRLGYELEEIRWDANRSPKQFEQLLLDHGVQGVLVPPHNALLDWGDFDWNKFSIVRFGASVQKPDSNLVTADHFQGMVMAVRRIAELGYQRIGLIAGEAYNLRLGGNYASGFYYGQVLLKLRPALPVLLTDYGRRDRAGMEKQKNGLQKWLARWKPDAVVTTDVEIPGLIRELGYRIPQHIAVAGTSVRDVPVDAGIDQLSTVIGQVAAETLVKQINLNERGEPADPCRILVESGWQDGTSMPPRRPAAN